MSRELGKDRVERVITDLMKANSQLMKGVGNIVVDYKLINDAPIAARQLLEDIRMGKFAVEYRKLEDDEDELEMDFG